MSKLFFLLSLFAFLFITSCHQEIDLNKNLQSEIESIIKDKNPQEIDSIIIIPGAGCGGCITGSLQYVIDQHNTFKKTVVIFTRIVDIKLLRLTVTDNFLAQKNIFTDDDEKVNLPDQFLLYPTLLTLKKGSINKIEIFNPPK